MRSDVDLCVSLPPCCATHSLLGQLFDVAQGLEYLHACNVIHGGLKGVRYHAKFRFVTVLTHNQSNVLVDAAGRARITDFGLAIVTRNLDSMRSAPAQYGHRVRWIAPEILHGGGPFSREADVFSFSMVVIEVRCRLLLGLTSYKLLFPRKRLSLARFRFVANLLTRP